MKVYKHHLPWPPTLGDWLESSVAQPCMLVWLEGAAAPLVLGHLTTSGDGDGRCGIAHRRVVAYARLDVDALEVVDA